MILSYAWLKELTGTSQQPSELAENLTRIGLNIEDVTPVDGDHALDAEITTNRPDWLCHLGVAHEIAAVEKGTVTIPPASLRETGPAVTGLTSVTVMPGADLACPRYTVRVIRGVKVGPSPEWLRQRLTAIGQRSINNVVDITNLVCFEMNQPLHAFDMDKLADKRIVLRMAEPGEKFAAITGENAELDEKMLVIADAEKAVALAGVKGGSNTEVGFSTVNVLLESAYFQPRSTRHAARRSKMSSESSYRYERGIDPGMTERASARAAHLILELAGGELATGVIDTNPGLGQPWRVSMRFSRCHQLLGLTVEPAQAVEILRGLGLTIISVDADAVTVEVPSFRQDLRREVDLIEEVIRLAGYDNIPEKITMPLALAHETPEVKTARTVRRTMAALGYHECITDAFVPAEWGQAFAPEAAPFRIQNPINAERPVMRAALVPSLLEVRRTNRLAQEVQLFEIGRTYQMGENGPEEKTCLAILDDRGPEFVRGAIEAVCHALSLAGDMALTPEPARPAMHPSSGAAMSLDGRTIAGFGLLGEAMIKEFDLITAPAVGEVDLDYAAVAPRLGRHYHALPRFPGIRRDISLSVAENVTWGSIEAIVRKSAQLLDSLQFESLYRGKGMAPGHKGMAFSMVLRSPDRSLTDAEANAIRDAVASTLLTELPGSTMR